MFFQEKKDLVGVSGPFWTQCILESPGPLQIYFKVLHIERGQEAHENHVLI